MRKKLPLVNADPMATFGTFNPHHFLCILGFGNRRRDRPSNVPSSGDRLSLRAVLIYLPTDNSAHLSDKMSLKAAPQLDL